MIRACYLAVHLVASMILVSVSSADYSCSDRYCFISTGTDNRTTFDCGPGQLPNNTVQCVYNKISHHIILTTEDNEYVSVDSIASGAFKRLLNGTVVEKIFINKFQFESLNKTDFEGLSNITEMKIENPKKLGTHTFGSLTTQRQYFILTISCMEGNRNTSFSELQLKSKLWRLVTENCQETFTCQMSTSDSAGSGTFSRIIPLDLSTNFNFQLSSKTCNSSCGENGDGSNFEAQLKRRNNKDRQVVIKKKETSSNDKVKNLKPFEYYDYLMMILLVVIGSNTVFVTLICVFACMWLKKTFNSAMRKRRYHKPTVAVEDQ